MCAKGLHDQWRWRAPRAGCGQWACWPCKLAAANARAAKARPPKDPKTPYVPTRTHVTWAWVQEAIEFHSLVYEAPRAVREATKDLGITESAMRLHLKRHPEYTP